jgi:very-short-patch-repair endonuclease
MASTLPEDLRRLAQLQRGILSTRQLRACGLSKNLIRSRVLTGRWQQMQHGVYAVFSGEPSREAALWAAVLRAGRAAMLSHQTAAELDGLLDRPSKLIHVTIPQARRVAAIQGVVIHISARAELTRHPTQLPPRTRIEETALDLAQCSATAEEACAWIARALGRRLTTQDRLASALGQRQRIRFRDDLAMMLTPDLAGIHSALEYRYVRWVEVPHGLPRGRRQVRVRRGEHHEYRDVEYQDYGLVVELDGRAAHPGDARWKDIWRDNATAATGERTLRYGWDDLTKRPCLVAEQVLQALGRSGPVKGHPCSASCPVSRRESR